MIDSNKSTFKPAHHKTATAPKRSRLTFSSTVEARGLLDLPWVEFEREVRALLAARLISVWDAAELHALWDERENSRK